MSNKEQLLSTKISPELKDAFKRLAEDNKELFDKAKKNTMHDRRYERLIPYELCRCGQCEEE